MTVYSHSRLSCYEQCPARFKFQYIDKVETEVEETVEAFLGTRVHEALEKLYRDLQFKKENSLEELLSFFRTEWEAQWSEDIVIVREEYTAENYRRMGEQYLSDYYKRYHPFDQGRTIALEEQIRITLDEEGAYKLQGYIDRLTEASDGCYEIHDYKTNSRLPLPQYLQKDRQLALYMIGVKDNYPDVRDVRLIWHFLKFDKEVDSTRTDAQLAQLKAETMRLIDTIEADERFTASPGWVCDWCEYQQVCGQWKHLHTVREKPANQYLKDSGVQLVNRYAELRQQQRAQIDKYNAELETVEEALIAFAEKEHVDCVFGTKKKVRISESERLVFPSKSSRERGELEALIKRMGVWAEVDSLDTAALGRVISEKQCTKEFLAAVKKYVGVEKKKRLWVSAMKDVS